jgi:hypothetical protein
VTDTDDLRRISIAVDMFNSERRRGWLANKCGVLGERSHANMNGQEYVHLFSEQFKDLEMFKLEEMADWARPSNMPTAFEREQKVGNVVPFRQRGH